MALKILTFAPISYILPLCKWQGTLRVLVIYITIYEVTVVCDCCNIYSVLLSNCLSTVFNLFMSYIILMWIIQFFRTWQNGTILLLINFVRMIPTSKENWWHTLEFHLLHLNPLIMPVMEVVLPLYGKEVFMCTHNL